MRNLLVVALFLMTFPVFSQSITIDGVCIAVESKDPGKCVVTTDQIKKIRQDWTFGDILKHLGPGYGGFPFLFWDISDGTTRFYVMPWGMMLDLPPLDYGVFSPFAARPQTDIDLPFYEKYK